MPHKIILLFACLFVCGHVEDAIVPVCDSWLPPTPFLLLPTPTLSAMLQSAKLLSESLERHMLSAFPSCRSLTPFRSTFGLYFIWCWVGGERKKKRRRKSSTCEHQSTLSREYSRLMRFTLEHKDRSGHAWMHSWAGHTETQMPLCGLSISRAACVSLAINHKHQNKMITRPRLLRPYNINGGNGGAQVRRHGAVSTLTCADIYS